MSTSPHLNAKKGDFAKTVLLPGDPVRAKYIANTYLSDIKEVNTSRNNLGYTGTYKNKKISVLSSGMGIPSVALYSHELYNFFDVDNIIRIGSAGSLRDFIHLNDIIVATACHTNSKYGENFGFKGTIAGIADFTLLKRSYDAVKKLNLKSNVHFGSIYTHDDLYVERKGSNLDWSKMDTYGVEMEGYALYVNAMRYKKRGLCICTVSDDQVRGVSLSNEEKETGFDDMIKLALEIAE